MTRVLLCGMLLLAATRPAPVQQPRPGIEQTLKHAVEDTPRGNLARARLKNEAAQRIEELAAGLRHVDDDVRVSAAWALRFSADKQKAVPPLAAALLDENFSVSRAAAVSLNHFDAAAEHLRKLMKHPITQMRWRGVINVDYTAGQLQAKSRTALMEDVGQLALGDPVDFIRADAAWTLRHGSGELVAEVLVNCLADPAAAVRWRARESLLKGGVSQALRQPDSAVRGRSLEALLKVLETQRGKSYATQAAAELLAELVVKPIGSDPVRWRKLVETLEGGK